MARKPVTYEPVPWRNVWGIKGGWKTINSTMGFYRTRAKAQAAIDAMTVRRTVVVVRKVPYRRPTIGLRRRAAARSLSEIGHRHASDARKHHHIGRALAAGERHHAIWTAIV